MSKEYVDSIKADAAEALKKKKRKKKIKGMLEKLKYSFDNPQPGSIGERISSGIQDFKVRSAREKAGWTPEEIVAQGEKDRARRRMLRNEYEKQKKKDKEHQEYLEKLKKNKKN